MGEGAPGEAGERARELGSELGREGGGGLAHRMHGSFGSKARPNLTEFHKSKDWWTE